MTAARAVVTPDRRPTAVGSVVAVLAALAATGVVAGRPAQLGALALEATGLALVLAASRRDDPWTRLLAVAGWAVVAAALGVGAVRPETVSHRVELLPGMVGAAVVAAGLVGPPGWTRRLVAVGVSCVVIGVLASGVVYEAGSRRLLAGAALAVLAGDAGENAASLGRQVGRDGVTARFEAAHVAASALVGALAVGAAVAASALPLPGVPVATVLLLLLAVLALAIALWV